MQFRSVKYVLVLMIFPALTMSCAPLNSGINKNNRKIKSMSNKLSESNGNSFFIKLPKSNFGKVWSYSRDSLYVYILLKGKVSSTGQYNVTHQYNFDSLLSKPILDTCIDNQGYFWGYRIRKDELYKNGEFRLALDCFFLAKHGNQLLGQLVKDILFFGIWKLPVQQK